VVAQTETETQVVAEIGSDYKYGFHSPDAAEDYFFKSGRGLSHELVEAISEHKNEPDWMREFRLKALEHFLSRPQPTWGSPMLADVDYDDTLSVAMKVSGEGGVSLNYQIQTTDIVFYDWFNASLTTPSGEVPLVSNYNPNPDLFQLYVGPVESLSVDLTPYKGQMVTLHLTSHQDGFGDQFQTLITNLTTFGLD
jgi:hypothetical protein